MSHGGHKSNAPKQKSEFRKMAMEVAMERALTAQSLNQTLDPATKCTDFDQQTWLSTAFIFRK